MLHYINNVTAADQAVKICRINVNAAARNIREMALNNDTSAYDLSLIHIFLEICGDFRI